MSNPKALIGNDCVEVLMARTHIWTLKEQLEFISQIYLDAEGFFNSSQQKLEFIIHMLIKEAGSIDAELTTGWKIGDIKDEDIEIIIDEDKELSMRSSL